MSDQNSPAELLHVGLTTEFEVGKVGKEDKFVVEKASAEGLPPGWIKEIRVTKKGRKIRKDPFYTDPVSGYVFRSLKDIHRYLKTGELGRLALKPKDKDCISVELGDDKFSSHAVAEGQKIADSGTYRQIIGNQSSKLVGIVKDEQILESTCTEDRICLSEPASDQCREGSAASGVHLTEAKGLEQIEMNSESTDHMFVSAPLIGVSPEKLSLANGVERQGNIQRGIKKPKEKRKPELPRRASKRLAGIEVDPAQELKTNNRTRRVAPRRPDEAETSSTKNSGDVANPEECTGKAETENMAHEKLGLPNVSLLGSQPIPEEHAGHVETDNMADVKPESPLNLSLTDLWTDPCIEFAVKTLTGAIPIGDENTGDENVGSPLEFPLGEFWTDPCIEFAVKTLTGAIPVVDDLGIQDYFQHHVSSSQTREDNNGSTLPNVGNFCQTDLLSQHYEQQDRVTPLPPRTGNVSLQNSGDNGLHQYAEGRNGECARSRVI